MDKTFVLCGGTGSYSEEPTISLGLICDNTFIMTRTNRNNLYL